MMCPRCIPTFQWLFFALACCFTAGCGDDEGRFVISGNVTFDGQPIAKGSIGFVPMDTETGKSVGTEIIDGHYEFPRHEGPTAGTYQVIITADRPTGRMIQADEGSSEMLEQIEQYIPEIYNEISSLTEEISGDRDDMNFELKKQKKKKRRRRR